MSSGWRPSHSLRPVTRAVFDRVNAVVEPIASHPWSGPPVVGVGLTLVETTGRRTGRVRVRPVLAGRVGALVAVGTARRRSDWVANVRSEPVGHVWLDGERVPSVASAIPLPVGWLAILRTASQP